jgi:hypothetical protein
MTIEASKALNALKSLFQSSSCGPGTIFILELAQEYAHQG